MDELLFSVKIVLPLFIFMATGWGLRRLGVVDDVFVDKTSKFIYRFCMPVMLLYNLYSSDLRSSFSGGVILYAIGITVFIIAFCWIIVPRFERERPKAGVIIQATFRSNFLLFAVHIMTSMYGESSLGQTLLLVAVMSFTYNIGAVVVLSFFGGMDGKRLDIKKALISVITNPLILGSLAGVILSLTGVKLGGLIDGVLEDISALATPLALIALGGQFKFDHARKNLRGIAACCVGRLIIAPLLIIGGAYLLGFRGVDLGLLTAMAISPVAVNSYVMARQSGCDGGLAGEAVVFTSALSTVTIFLIIFLLRALSLL